MHVACFYSDLHPLAREALPPDAELVYTGGGDYAYWQAICERWTGEDDLVFIEHDIEIHDQVIPQFAACASPWCAFGYWYPPELAESPVWQGLGCTRFSAACQRSFPVEAIVDYCAIHDGLPPAPAWHSCDAYITRTMINGGLAMCRHYPLVAHYRREAA